MATKFPGFEDGMFSFFSRRKKDLDEVPWIHGRMELFGQKLLSKGLQQLAPSFYKDYHVGVFHPEEDESFWVAFGFEDLDDLLKAAHQTVSLSEAKLEVYVRVGSVAAIDLLRRGIGKHRESFLETVAGLPEPFEIQVRERTRVSPTRFVVSQPVLTLPPAEARDPTSSGFAELVQRLTTIEYPHFSLRRRLEKKLVLELGGGELIDEVLSIMKAFQPLVDFINASK
jgi:hypothetical protein